MCHWKEFGFLYYLLPRAKCFFFIAIAFPAIVYPKSACSFHLCCCTLAFGVVRPVGRAHKAMNIGINFLMAGEREYSNESGAADATGLKLDGFWLFYYIETDSFSNYPIHKNRDLEAQLSL